MRVIIKDEVLDGITDFINSLYNYHIPFDRMIAKGENMESFLQSLGTATFHSVCKWKDLGQILDEKGNPQNKDLKQAIYTDKESKSSWTFSYIIDERNDILYITQMKFSNSIKCSSSSQLEESQHRISDSAHNRGKVRYPFLTGLLEYRNKTIA